MKEYKLEKETLLKKYKSAAAKWVLSGVALIMDTI
jgi:hypothetical protein